MSPETPHFVLHRRAGAALCQSSDAADVHLSALGDQVKDSKHHRATLVDSDCAGDSATDDNSDSFDARLD